MALNAEEAVPGKVYRRTRGEHPGAYYMRPKTVDAATLIRRMKKRHLSPSGRDVWLMMLFKREPERILFKRYIRGIDFITGEKWEFNSYVLIPPDYRLRECKSKPGYVKSKTEEK